MSTLSSQVELKSIEMHLYFHFAFIIFHSIKMWNDKEITLHSLIYEDGEVEIVFLISEFLGKNQRRS